MAMIDYGALLRVDGKFINKNKGMFMEGSDTGYICEKAIDLKSGNDLNIDRNFFIYAGDEDFLVVFYKCSFHVISNEKIIYSQHGTQFLGEELFFDGFPTIKIEHLDKKYRNVYYDKPDEIEIEWCFDNYEKNKAQLLINRGLKHSRRIAYKELSNRFLATWKHNGKNYEVIFGYGIEPNQDVYDDIKNNYYDFSDTEKEIIDSWFESLAD